MGTSGPGDWTESSLKSDSAAAGSRCCAAPTAAAEAHLPQRQRSIVISANAGCRSELLAARAGVAGGRAGQCSLSSLMRLRSPNLTANRIFMLCTFIAAREREGRRAAVQGLVLQRLGRGDDAF